MIQKPEESSQSNQENHSNKSTAENVKINLVKDTPNVDGNQQVNAKQYMSIHDNLGAAIGQNDDLKQDLEQEKEPEIPFSNEFLYLSSSSSNEADEKPLFQKTDDKKKLPQDMNMHERMIAARYLAQMSHKKIKGEATAFKLSHFK